MINPTLALPAAEPVPQAVQGLALPHRATLGLPAAPGRPALPGQRERLGRQALVEQQAPPEQQARGAAR